MIIAYFFYMWCIPYQRQMNYERVCQGKHQKFLNAFQNLIYEGIEVFFGFKRNWYLSVEIQAVTQQRRVDPTDHFHNYRASKSVDRRFQTTYNWSINGFWGGKNVKGSVGKGEMRRPMPEKSNGIFSPSLFPCFCFRRLQIFSCTSLDVSSFLFLGGFHLFAFAFIK